MKAVAAVVLTTGISQAGLAATGIMLGAALLILGLTGWIRKVGRLVAQSVLAGLQLGLGLALALESVDLLRAQPWLGGGILVLLLAMLKAPRYPGALIALAVAVAAGQLTGATGTPMDTAAAGINLPPMPAWADLERALSVLVLPQLALSLTNAVLLTALIAGDYYGDKASHVTTPRLAISSGLANLLLVPFGALPMCHGAGGLAAHHRFGARSGTAPLLLGLALTSLALLPADMGLAVFAAIPTAALGALLLVAAGELALTKRLFDCKPSCWPVIAVTASVTVAVNPFAALLAGGVAEMARTRIVRRLYGRRTRNRTS
jgi:MFS superfamily sulfate permease-like transporter